MSRYVCFSGLNLRSLGEEKLAKAGAAIRWNHDRPVPPPSPGSLAHHTCTGFLELLYILAVLGILAQAASRRKKEEEG